MKHFVFLCVLLVSACRTTTTSFPPNMSAAAVTRSTPTGAWEVVDGGRVVGFVVRYEAVDVPGSAYFSVRNEHRQELGIVSADGRAWRYRAHASEAEWLGSGTVLQGALGILDASLDAQLDPIDLAQLAVARESRAPRRQVEPVTAGPPKDLRADHAP